MSCRRLVAHARRSLALAPLALLLATACSGGDSSTGDPAGSGGSTAGSGGTTGGSGGQSTGGSGGQSTGGSAGKAAGGSAGQAGAGQAGAAGKIACETTNDCVGAIPETKPASCAKAVCDPAEGFCRFVAKDLDGDGDPSNSCTSLDATVTIELGGDCDDGDESVSSKAWDGPEGTAQGVTQPDRCDDGLDNDCNGTVDDDALDDGTTCKCTPDDVRKCAQDSAGKPITFPGGQPQGLCTLGNQTCEPSGKWGPCTGAVGPTDEICDKKDNDCDGLTDEDDALNKKNWYWDADGDNHGDKAFGAVNACDPPASAPAGCAEGPTTSCTVGPESWKLGAFPDDCNDRDTTANPEAKEVCDGTDNNCDGQTDEGATNAVTWYRDEDGDGFLGTDVGLLLSKTQCSNPGLDPANCPGGQAPCESRWIKEGGAKLTDCNDTNADVHPGAWDGPATPLRMGFTPPGLKAEFFKIAAYPAVPDLSKLSPIQPRIDVTINYNIGQGTLSAGLPNDLAARWTGQLTVTEDGEYTFYPETDDGVRLWVGDLAKPVVDKWQGQGPTEYPAKVTLTKGSPVPFRMEWFDYSGQGVAILRWAGPGFGKQALTVALDPTPEQQSNRCGDGLDNDCNGVTDDGRIRTSGSDSVLSVGCTTECNPIDPDPAKNVTRACGLSGSVGICHPGSQYCQPGGTWSACGGEQKPEPEVCDGLDNNCAGGPDENDIGGGSACTVAGKQGVCAAGIMHCHGASGLTCDQSVNPSNEVCNGKDDDCDGPIDETFPGKGQSCQRSVGTGACRCGANVCVGGKESCGATLEPNQDQTFHTQPVTCPGVSEWDTNCNGSVETKYPFFKGWPDAIPLCNGIKTEAECINYDFFNDIGNFYVSSSFTVGCGSVVKRQQCWWSANKGSCQVGASISEAVACR